MFFRAQEISVNFSLERRTQRQTLATDNEVGYGYLEEDFDQRLHQLTASGSACQRDRRVRRGWQAAETLGRPEDYISSAPVTLDCGSLLEICECTFCLGHELFLKRVDQTIQGSASDAGRHIQLVRYFRQTS